MYILQKYITTTECVSVGTKNSLFIMESATRHKKYSFCNYESKSHAFIYWGKSIMYFFEVLFRFKRMSFYRLFIQKWIRYWKVGFKNFLFLVRKKRLRKCLKTRYILWNNLLENNYSYCILINLKSNFLICIFRNTETKLFKTSSC